MLVSSLDSQGNGRRISRERFEKAGLYNNKRQFTVHRGEAIIDHRTPIEAYRFDTTDLEPWCVKTEAGE